jgi:putative ABC transport system substrate-binding protein
LRYLLLSIAALLLAALPAAGAELLIVESRHGKVFDQAAQQIISSCGKSSETLVMSDYAEFDLGRIVREEQPRIVVAIGEQALREARKLRRTDVVYLLTLNVNEKALGKNILGISMHVAPDKYLQLFRQLQRRRIGIIYDPGHSAAWLERARRAASGSGIELVTQQISSPRDVSAALQRLGSADIDALWMIPDSTAVAPENIDAYFLFAQQKSLPVVSFARGYLDKGALAVLEGSPDSIAEQGCALVNRLRQGIPAAEQATVDVNRPTLATNESVARRLQLQTSGLQQLFRSP